MTSTVAIELTTRRKCRNASEYRPINVASCLGLSVEGDGQIIVILAQKLLETKVCEPSLLVTVRREGTTCFSARTVGEWAAGTPGRGEQPAHLRRVAA